MITVARSSHPREMKSCRGSWRKGPALYTLACVHRPDYALYPHRCRAYGLLLGTIPLIKIPVLDAVNSSSFSSLFLLIVVTLRSHAFHPREPWSRRSCAGR